MIKPYLRNSERQQTLHNVSLSKELQTYLETCSIFGRGLSSKLLAAARSSITSSGYQSTSHVQMKLKRNSAQKHIASKNRPASPLQN